MKWFSRWLLYIIPVLLCCGLAVVYLLTVKKIRPPFAMPTLTDSLAVYGEIWDLAERKMYIHEPLYIGPWQQHIRLQHPTNWEGFPEETEVRDRASCNTPDSLQLQLVVDTTQRIAHYTQDPSLNGIVSHVVQSYPVMLANLGHKFLCIGGGSDLPVIQEALDTTGQWRTIEKPFLYNCVTGVPGRRLPPGHIAIVASPVYKGSYHTRMRVRYGSVVSNEFMGNINLSQLK